MLPVRRFPAKLVNILQLQAGDVNDFLRVATEVGHAIENSGQEGRIEALDAARLEKLLVRKSGQCQLGVMNDRIKTLDETAFRNMRSLRKFLRTITRIGPALDPDNQPLPNIAA